MTDDQTPAMEKTAFRCPHCGAFAQQEWSTLGEGVREEQYIGFEAIAEPTAIGTAQWLLARGMACKHSSIWLDEQMVYPAISTLPPTNPAMEADIKALYEEARAVAAVSPRAGAALARATLEVLLKRLVGQAGDDDAGKRQIDLCTLLDRAKDQVGRPLRKVLTVLRHVGNEGLHPKEEPDEATVLVLNSNTTAALGMLFKALNDLVDEMVVEPAAVDELFDSLPERLRKPIEDEESDAEEEQAF